MTTPVSFFRETQAELKKVVWPTRQEVTRLTGLVIGASVLVSAFIGGLDYIFTRILTLIAK